MRGLLMHSSLAITLDGLPLGLAGIKFWTRKQFKGCNALKRKINPTRVPIEEKESFRWLENLRQSTALSTIKPLANRLLAGLDAKSLAGRVALLHLRISCPFPRAL